MDDLHIQPEMRAMVVDAMAEVRKADLSIIQHQCMRCGHPMKYPMIAREGDLMILQTMLDAAQKYLDDNGVLGKMLAAIRAQCHYEIVRRKAAEQLVGEGNDQA